MKKLIATTVSIVTLFAAMPSAAAPITQAKLDPMTDVTTHYVAFKSFEKTSILGVDKQPAELIYRCDNTNEDYELFVYVNDYIGDGGSAAVRFDKGAALPSHVRTSNNGKALFFTEYGSDETWKKSEVLENMKTANKVLVQVNDFRGVNIGVFTFDMTGSAKALADAEKACELK